MNFKSMLIVGMLVLFGCTVFCPPQAVQAREFITAEWIDQQIKQSCKIQTTEYSILVKDLRTGQVAYLNPMRYGSASLIKVYIMAEAFNLKKQGKLDFNETITINKQDQFAWGSLDKVADGTKVTVGELVEQMIVVSDNTATNILIDKIGMENINDFIKKIGCNETVLGRHMLDSAAKKAGRDNYTSPRDMANILGKIYKGKCVDKKSDKKMLEILSRQQWNERIPANLPHDLRIAHKTGELADALHDCGIIFGYQRDYILCIMTKGVPAEHAGYDDNNALEYNDMALISKLIWNKLDDPILSQYPNNIK